VFIQPDTLSNIQADSNPIITLHLPLITSLEG
jgi:hypothetical protein